jgi:hypothetical protein
MTALIGALIFCAIVVLVAGVCIWAIDTILAALGGPPVVSVVARVVIILIALLVIINKLLPLAGQFT